MLLRISYFIATIFFAAVLFSCKHDKPNEPVNPGPADTVSGYPLAIENIMVKRCATAGCHNQASHQNAGGLLLDTWEHMLQGSGNGAVIVPFSPDNSPLLYFINTHPSLGPVATPTMPLNGIPLTQDEYMMIASWVASGAANKDGVVPFASETATRQKIYITMQGCDLVGVVDAKSRVIMRYIPVGKDNNIIESPHRVGVSHDGRYAYVCFFSGEYIQKIDVEKDSVIADLYVGDGSWNVFALSQDDKQMLLTDLKGGKLLLINTEAMTKTATIVNNFVQPHGVVHNGNFTIFYVTAQSGNIVYRINIANPQVKTVTLDGNPPVTNAGVLDPHEILMVPDNKRYFVTCQATDEVRVMDAIADTLIKVIPVGNYPQEIAISSSTPYIFVTCMEDQSSFGGFKGSVYAINYNTYEATRIEGPFYQPHGITVDDQNGTFYVVSRNANPNGPAPHHSSSCSGRNGYYHVYDLHTFQRLPKRYEAVVEPYSADARFK